MNLLFLADSVYSVFNDEVYALRVFGEEFFSEYLKVFEKVTICARRQQVDQLPEGSPKLSDSRINFLGVGNVHGLRWALGLRKSDKELIRRAVREADAVVARLPSTIGRFGFFEAKAAGKPFLGEIVGDPWDSISNYSSNPLLKAYAWFYCFSFRRLVKKLEMVSYVSRRVLALRYPTSSEAITEEYSSIRLANELICAPRHYDESPRPIEILCLLSFLGYKRHVDLIKACFEMRRRSIAFRLHLIGDGHTMPQIQGLVEELGLEDVVKFYGYIADVDELFRTIDSCHLVVVPSAQEGLPRSMLEGMARGLGGVGSDVGGIPDLVRETEVFTVGNFKMLADILCNIASDPVRMTEMSEHAVNVSRKYTAAELGPRRLRMYRLLASAASAPS